MTHTLSDGCQTFSFTPSQSGISVLRKALNGRTGRWRVTGTFQMSRTEARAFWSNLTREGARRV